MYQCISGLCNTVLEYIRFVHVCISVYQGCATLFQSILGLCICVSVYIQGCSTLFQSILGLCMCVFRVVQARISVLQIHTNSTLVEREYICTFIQSKISNGSTQA